MSSGQIKTHGGVLAVESWLVNFVLKALNHKVTGTGLGLPYTMIRVV